MKKFTLSSWILAIFLFSGYFVYKSYLTGHKYAEVSVVALVDTVHMGDNNNALGIQDELSKHLRQSGYTVHTASIQSDRDLAAKEGSFYIVIGAGQQSIQPLSQIKKNMEEQCFTVWSGHQGYPGLDEPLFDTIILPIHIVNDSNSTLNIDKQRLIKITGVMHNTTRESLEAEHKRWKKYKLKSGNYMIVMLAGDAITSDGNVNCYGADEANRLGEYIGRIALESSKVILLSNGPRTGKSLIHDSNDLIEYTIFDPQIGKVITKKTDAVSLAFMQGVQNIQNNLEQLHFFDFRSNQNVSYTSLLSLAYKDKTVDVYLPGESVFLVSEACDMLENNIFVYDNDSMNEMHYRYIDQLSGAGYVSRIDQQFNVTLSKVTKKQPQYTKTLAVAQKLKNRIMQKIPR